MGKRADARRRDSRRRALRILPLAAVLVVLALGGGAALAHWQGRGQGVTGAAQDTVRPLLPPSQSPEAADPEPRPTSSAPSRNRPPVAEPPTKVPASGAGTFTTARGTGRPSGSGTLRRYRVQVEDGVDIPAKDAAAEIEQILAHPRGWGGHGRGSFQLVESEADADFVIRIATPATADSLCLKQGLDTHGELNCETADGVVVNLRRWTLGSPTFKGTPDEYRHLIINHEVGHEIGISRHLGCGGPGRLAPVMMQQIKGLDGCRSNAWPYDEDGTYITGPEL
ncbi:DUF3152 domain-containing protein [Streptomyces sp. NBC_01410]|uniref:DUF3152 domain-containing protein n=1 Tax=Streptomyces sp. NBC_01410 TaxID=2903856 RepID=UPI0032445D41